MFGLFFQFVWGFDDFGDHAGVAEVFETVMDVGALLVLSEEFLGALEETILDLGKGLACFESLLILDDGVKNGLIVDLCCGTSRGENAFD